MPQSEKPIRSLREWEAETGNKLPMAAELIAELEEGGYVVDLVTGEVGLAEEGEVSHEVTCL